MSDVIMYKPESDFTSYFEGLEKFPVTEAEAARIMSVNSDILTTLLNRGAIVKSLRCKLGAVRAFSFFNFYDIYKAMLINELHISAIRNNPSLNSLLDELLDEFMIQFDKYIFDDSKLSISDMIKALEHHFEERQSLWRALWLLEGERMDPSKAARICVNVWIETFNITTIVICEFRLWSISSSLRNSGQRRDLPVPHLSI